MRYLSVDQSLASCAWTLWEDDKPLEKGIIKTGSKWIKTKPKPDVVYFEVITEQLQYVVYTIRKLFVMHSCDYIVFESPAQSGFGNAVAALKTLFRALEETWKAAGEADKFFSITPTSLKAYARPFLPAEDQTDGFLKTGQPNKVKMLKKHMVQACNIIAPELWLHGYSVSSGGGDLADSFLLGHYFYNKLI